MRKKPDDLAQGDADAGCRLLWQAVIMRAIDDIRSPLLPPGMRADQTAKYASREDRDDAIRFMLDDSPASTRHRRVVFELAGIMDHSRIKAVAAELAAGRAVEAEPIF